MAGRAEIYVVVRTEDDKLPPSVEIPPTKFSSKFECSSCRQTFTKRSYLVRHVKARHGVNEQSVKETPDIVGRCPDCSNKFQKRIDLLHHLANEHKYQITIFDLEFSSALTFTQWFEEVKIQYQTSFASHSGKVLRDGTKTKMYHCNRDVQANGKKTRKRYTRATTDYCTAHLYVRQKVSGEISVLGSPTHMNHEVDPSLVTKPNLPINRIAMGYREIMAVRLLPQEYFDTLRRLDPIVKEIQTQLTAKPYKLGATLSLHNLLLKVKKCF